MRNVRTFKILEDVARERDRQDGLWGGTPGRDRVHDAGHLLAVLGEEYGEVCEALLEDLNLREELVQVAACAVAWAEQIDYLNAAQAAN